MTLKTIHETIKSNILAQLTDTNKCDVVKYMIEFNKLFVACIKEPNPIYKKTLYRMIDNMENYLTYKQESPYVIYLFKSIYLNTIQDVFS